MTPAIKFDNFIGVSNAFYQRGNDTNSPTGAYGKF